MAIEDTIISPISAIETLPPEIISQLTPLILLAKTVGIVFLVYIVFLIIKGILTIKTSRRIRQIQKKVNEIDHKLSKILKEKSSSHEKETLKKDKKKK